MAKPLNDANDLHLRGGLPELRRQVLEALESDPLGAPESMALATVSDSLVEAPPSDYIPLDAYADDPDLSPAPSGERTFDEAPRPVEKRGPDEEALAASLGRYDIPTLRENFWLVYGTDTVWDNINRVQMRLSHLRHAILKERFNLWQDSPDRHIVRGIKFEPGLELGRDWVNLYDGIKMQPDRRGEAGCSRIISHLRRLCKFRDAEFDWLLRWVAYPLQRPGKKMASSVIMYGSEGPGKSIIWELVVKRMYGEYGVTIGQAQLDSQFTGWQSKRLFAVAEEVVSRSERSHHKGALKHLVTGETLRVNEKNLPEHEESNHLNFVFLSNSTVPLELDFGDRRYLVLYCDDVPPPGYFMELIEEIENGGVESFYHYLLNLDLGDFNAHTKPPMNEEKKNLISSSLPAALYFLQEWREGNLDHPYGAVQVSDLWMAFERWSERSNEFKRRRRDFEAEVRRVCQHERTMLGYPSVTEAKTTRFWVPPGAIEPGVDRVEFLRLAGEQCRFFSASLGARAKEGRESGDR